jgi:hypothetical protein
MTQADRVHSTPRITASKTNPPDQPTRDDELGMAWWNSLTKQERAKWSALAGNTGRPKDAWEAFKRGSMDQSPPVDQARRRFFTVAAGASVASVGSLVAAAAAPVVDIDLVKLGARFEPLVDRYYIARRRWAAALTQAHAEHAAEFGCPDLRDFDRPEIGKAFEDSCERSGANAAGEALHAIFKEMAPLASAINAASVTSIEGFRAKALVAFWEVASHWAQETANSRSMTLGRSSSFSPRSRNFAG